MAKIPKPRSQNISNPRDSYFFIALVCLYAHVVVCLYLLKFENFLPLCSEIYLVRKKFYHVSGENGVPVCAETREFGEILKSCTLSTTVID